MNTPRIAVIAAASAVVAWAVKAVAIGVAGGLDKSPFEGPFFLIGLVCFVVAVCTLAVSAVGRHGWLARIGAVIASVAGTVAVTAVIGLLIDAVVTSDHWAWYELNLWVISLGLLAFVTWYSGRQVGGSGHRLEA
jgi:hypothetical protein